MKKFTTAMLIVCCMLMSIGTFTVSAGDIKDPLGILIDNCDPQAPVGQNVAKGSVGYFALNNWGDSLLASVGSEDNYYHEDGHWYECAIDDDPTTFAAAGGQWEYSVIADLQQTYMINRIAITFVDGSYPVDYDIYISTEPYKGPRKYGTEATQNWAQSLVKITGETNNETAGVHEFNFEPMEARCVVIMDNIPQVNVRQMGIATLEINEVADFADENGQYVPKLKTGTIRTIENGSSGLERGMLINALYDKETNRLINVSTGMIESEYEDEPGTADVSLTVDKVDTYEDFTRTSLQDTYFTPYPSPVDEGRLGASITHDVDIRGTHSYMPEYIYGGIPDAAANAFDDFIHTKASAAGSWTSALAMDFGEEKTFSHIDVTFDDFLYPIDFEIVTIKDDGTREVIADVNGCTHGGRYELKFEPKTARKVYVYCDKAEENVRLMAIRDIHVYDKAPKYELRSFILDDFGTLTPMGEVKTLN